MRQQPVRQRRKWRQVLLPNRLWQRQLLLPGELLHPEQRLQHLLPDLDLRPWLRPSRHPAQLRLHQHLLLREHLLLRPLRQRVLQPAGDLLGVVTRRRDRRKRRDLGMTKAGPVL
jgi:hypothetical protein